MTAPQAAADYELGWLQAEAATRGHIADVLSALKASHAVSGRDIVEMGSGIGSNLALFATDNRVQGVDGLPAAAAHAARLGIPTLCADLEAAIPLPSCSADWVLCIDVLEHLQAPRACLAEAVRLLRPGGRIVVNVPNHFDWRGRLAILFGAGIDSQRYFPERPAWRYPHLRFFTRRDLASLLADAGLAVEADCSGMTTSLPKARLLSRMGLGGAIGRLSGRWPDLLQSGFFVVCRRVQDTAQAR